jgi:hypothetical protein
MPMTAPGTVGDHRPAAFVYEAAGREFRKV